MTARTFFIVVALFLACLPSHIAALGEEQATAPAPSRDETWQQMRSRLLRIASQSHFDSKWERSIMKIQAATSERELNACLQPLTLLHVFVNPESRVKINSPRPKIILPCDRPQWFLISVENTAGITAPLQLSSIDLSANPPRPANWCTIDVVNNSLTTAEFTGASREYKVVQITPHKSGLREVRIAGNAGQGTQDLGFRATTDLLLEIQPAENQNDES